MSIEHAVIKDQRSKTPFFVDQHGAHYYVGSNTIFANIKDFGAKGDGVTDDTAAIQKTIDDSPEGATIYFPPGTYIISQTIILKNSQSYLGSGSSYQSPTIKQANSANLIALMAVLEFMNNATYSSTPLSVSNLFFDGNSVNNTRPPANGGHGIIFQSSNSFIEECWFQDIPQTAIVFSDSNLAGQPITNSAIENHILNCKIDTTGQYGIWVRNTDGSGQCTDGYIRDNIVSSTADTSIFVDRGSGWFLSGNHVYGGQKSAIIVNRAWSTFISGNEVDGYGYNNSNAANYYTGIGVTCLGSRATIVEGNIVSTQEVNSRTIYQHLSINADDINEVRCLVTNNTILGGYVSTVGSTSITTAGSHTITVTNVTNISLQQVLTVDPGTPNQENIVVTALNQSATANGTTITANFSKPHNSPYSITSSSPRTNSTGIVVQSFSTQVASGQPFFVQIALNIIDGVGLKYSLDGSSTTFLAPNEFIGDVQTSSGDLKSGRHILSNASNASASAGTNNGSNPPSPQLIGNDTRGTINFGTGPGASAGLQVKVQFASHYASNPIVVISPANATTAQSGSIWYVR